MGDWKSPNQVGTSTSTTTNNSTVPDYVQNAQKNLMSAAGNLTLPFATQVPNFTVAGFNPDQEMAFGLARDNAQQAFTTPALNVNDFGSYNGTVTNAGEQQLDAKGINAFFNPFQQDVVGTTTSQLQKANDRQLAQIRARQAAEGAYGGNRGALEEVEQNRNFGDTLAHTVAGLNQSGWQNAANLGMGNTQLRQQTGLQNAQAANQMSQFNAGQTLQAANLQNQLNQTQWQKQMQGLQGLLGTGGMQQEQLQRALDVPYQALDRFRATVPGGYGSSSTSSSSQPIHGPSTFQSLLPIATAGLSLLSDRTMKTDIQKLGKDEGTGLDMYAYRYRGDPKNTPKVVGPMAQDVEKRYPGSTQRVGGKLAIKGSARSILGL